MQCEDKVGMVALAVYLLLWVIEMIVSRDKNSKE